MGDEIEPVIENQIIIDESPKIPYRVYDLVSRSIMWSEDCDNTRVVELGSLGYGVTELLVTQTWAKPTLTEDLTSIYNAATNEEQAIYESQFKGEE